MHHAATQVMIVSTLKSICHSHLGLLMMQQFWGLGCDWGQPPM